MPATVTKPLEVQILICPVCRKPSRIDGVAFKGTKGRAYCTGPIGDGHRRVKCVPTRFREVVS
jgi:phage/plasmid primase-like uncharacterized protein